MADIARVPVLSLTGYGFGSHHLTRTLSRYQCEGIINDAVSDKPFAGEGFIRNVYNRIMDLICGTKRGRVKELLRSIVQTDAARPELIGPQIKELRGLIGENSRIRLREEQKLACKGFRTLSPDLSQAAKDYYGDLFSEKDEHGNPRIVECSYYDVYLCVFDSCGNESAERIKLKSGVKGALPPSDEYPHYPGRPVAATPFDQKYSIRPAGGLSAYTESQCYEWLAALQCSSARYEPQGLSFDQIQEMPLTSLRSSKRAKQMLFLVSPKPDSHFTLNEESVKILRREPGMVKNYRKYIDPLFRKFGIEVEGDNAVIMAELPGECNWNKDECAPPSQSDAQFLSLALNTLKQLGYDQLARNVAEAVNDHRESLGLARISTLSASAGGAEKRPDALAESEQAVSRSTEPERRRSGSYGN